MDNYVVSARKYRPITFDSVVGQESITLTLKNALKTQQLAQAFLFCGPRGVGKTTCARILAKTINCMNPTENHEACNECESCVSFNNNASFNIHELDAASNNSVDHIRNLVDLVRIAPQVGKYKIYIIDEVHMLSQAAFNAFLKTLEEPPAYAKFILATTEKNKIIPTILSRCQVFDFKRITVDDIVKHLKYVAESEGIQAEDQALHVIAQKSDGGMRDALSLFDQQVSFSGPLLTYKNVIENLNILDYDYFFNMVDYILNDDVKNILLTINRIFDNGFEVQHFIIGFSEHLRSLLVSKDNATAQLLKESEPVKQRYAEQAKQCSEAFLLTALNIINKCDIEYRTSNNKRLLIEIGLLNICSALHADEKKKSDINKSNPVAEQKNNQISHPNVSSEHVSNKTGSTTVEVKTQKPDSETQNSEIKIKNTEPGTPNPEQRSSILRINKQKDETKEESTNKSFGNNRNKDFGIEEVKITLDKYLENIKDRKIHLFNSLHSKEFELKDNNIIVLHIANKVNEQEVINNNVEIAEFFRDELENDNLNVITAVTELEVEIPIYTDKEKFAKMAEENKNLILMQKKLNLEIEF
ncbi:MAG: DNA polymerase III subunit gamma/tau [Bacteroidales bacterium]|jgi:DNA polymerase-3 subunit gamma/tau|nr:DNA polymerase III subunit gamma/tau [Bacteroidales bacterium]